MFFYKKRGLQAPEPEPVGLKSYMLVRVAMDVGEEEWFGEKLRLPEETAWGEEPETAAVPKPAPETRFCPGKKRIPFGGLLRAIWPRRDRGREGGPKPNAAEAGEGQPEPLERTGGRLRKNRRKQAVREQAENREALLAGQAERIRITEAAVRGEYLLLRLREQCQKGIDGREKKRAGNRGRPAECGNGRQRADSARHMAALFRTEGICGLRRPVLGGAADAGSRTAALCDSGNGGLCPGAY